jgi:sporulation protein YlmC with PRC-barrel domain
MRFHELLDKKVIAADGRDLGRIVDLLASARGESLCVSALVVHRAGLLWRIAFRYLPLFRVTPPLTIPWELVARIGNSVQLRVDAADLEHPRRERGPEPRETVAVGERRR